MEIWICNQEQVHSMSANIKDRPYAHISITSYKMGTWPITFYGKNCIGSLLLRLDDVDEKDNNSTPITDAQGKVVYAFVEVRELGLIS